MIVGGGLLFGGVRVGLHYPPIWWRAGWFTFCQPQLITPKRRAIFQSRHADRLQNKFGKGVSKTNAMLNIQLGMWWQKSTKSNVSL